MTDQWDDMALTVLSYDALKSATLVPAVAAALRETAETHYQRGRADAERAAWLPIETAPKDGSFIVANRLGEVCPFVSLNGYATIGNAPGLADWSWPEQATHWRPLPAPPESGT